MDKLLFTPGPLTTSKTVKEAMLHDLGSRDVAFINAVKEIRSDLLGLGKVSKEAGYETVIMQGSGTFGVESVISSAVPKTGRMLILINGAYGERIAKIASVHKIPFETIVCDEDQTPDLEKAEKALATGNFTHLAIVHCETTSGIFNPIDSFGKLAAQYKVTYFVDSMSAFGAVPVDIAACNIDFLVSSSNKCIEGVPGFSFVIAKKEALEKCNGQADTLTLDLYAQWLGLEKDGQFRFTPPTHALLAFKQAMNELKEEGGVEARGARYKNNFNVLAAGMAQMGFKEYLPANRQGYIINSYHYPESAAFDFKTFYNKLNDRGYVIYPGKLTKANCFRVGNIGRLYAKDMEGLLKAMEEVKSEMGF
ncbi:MAG TPA: 2-aminoethylphosphonate--pyruvate transaminase [Chitinophagales bacterium]|nr:2-aminoethylphosphonate--pyruvate transaminase [Chitinophagales bacterium]